MTEIKKIKMQNVRICFPSLFSTESFGGEDTGKYTATFILDPSEHKAAIDEIKSEMGRITKETFKGKGLQPDRLCLKDGDDTDRPEFQGMMTIKASTKRRPLVINRDKTPLTEDDNVIYAGCYVNSIITLWAQDNQWGKRINANLEGVQFIRDGEPLGGGGIDADEFDAFDDDGDDPPF